LKVIANEVCCLSVIYVRYVLQKKLTEVVDEAM
jgi:hypothetical protein